MTATTLDGHHRLPILILTIDHAWFECTCDHQITIDPSNDDTVTCPCCGTLWHMTEGDI